MTGRIEVLKAEIHRELEKFQALKAEFESAVSRLDLSSPEPIPNYDRSAIGYLLHGFYNGCESIFRSIAWFFENDVGTGSWHKNLLYRMTLEIEGFRPAVIDEELYRLLDDFRAFRHRFRHSYSFELDWDRERMVALKFENAYTMLRFQVLAFLEKIEIG